MKNQRIHKMVGVSLLIAVIFVLQLLSALIPIKIGPVALSFVLIPVVVGSAVYGPGAGAVLGGAFGVIASICCANGMDPGGQMVFQASPVLCVLVVMLKGILAGAASGAVYRLLKNKNAYVAMLFSAIVCPVVNTGVFLIGMWLFFFDVLQVWANGSNVVGYILTGLLLINFLPELALNVFFSPAGQRIVKIVEKK